MSTLRTDGKLGVAAVTRTAGEVYTDLMEQGSAFVPALVLSGEEEPALLEQGYGVLIGDRLVGYLDGSAARGLELLASRACAEMVEVPGAEGRVAVRVTGSHTVGTLSFQGERPLQLRLTCRVECQLEEYQQALTGEEGAAIREEMERKCESWLDTALVRLQSWGADCVGLGSRAAVAHPGKWSAVQEEWAAWFSQLEIEVEVQVRIHD